MSTPLPEHAYEHTFMALLRLACVSAAHAESLERMRAATRPAHDAAPPRRHDPRQLVGTEIRNRDGWKIGVIDDLALDAHGQPTLAIVLTSGFLGTRDRRLAVPWSALHPGAHGEMVLDIDRTRLAQAPGFSDRAWSGLSDERWLAQNQRFFQST